MKAAMKAAMKRQEPANPERNMNVPFEVARHQVKVNSLRDLNWVTRQAPHKRRLVICSGGPSLNGALGKIRVLRSTPHVDIWAVNGAHDYLIANGIVPRGTLFADGGDEMLETIKSPHPHVTYYLATLCSIKMFEFLKEYTIVAWHSWLRGIEDVLEALPEDRPREWIGGGSTIGLRSLALGSYLGYRKIDSYGLDSSFALLDNKTAKQHAYDQTQYDPRHLCEVTFNGRKYLTSYPLRNQAKEFEMHYDHCKREGVKLRVHGTGLIPDICRHLQTTR